jgi:hypothetical protein
LSGSFKLDFQVEVYRAVFMPIILQPNWSKQLIFGFVQFSYCACGGSNGAVRISATASDLYEGDIEAAVDRSASGPRAAALDPRAKPRPCLRRPTPLGKEFASAAVSAWFATARAGADSATSCG